MNNFKYTKLFLIVWIFLFPIYSFAMCYTKQESLTYIVFSNGMTNSVDEAISSTNALELYAKEIIKNLKKNNQIPDYYKFEFDYAYNSNSIFFIPEIIEVYSQRNAFEKKKYVEWLVGSYSDYIPSYADRKKTIDSISYEIAFKPLVDDNKDLQDMVKKYTRILVSGGRLIIVAHSQGNMFAILAVEEILQKHPEYADAIGIIGVATPSAENSNVSIYTTASEDVIINKVRDLYGTTLDANSSIGDTYKKFSLNHSFIKNYMATPDTESENNYSKSIIRKGLEYYIKTLKNPNIKEESINNIRVAMDESSNQSYLQVEEHFLQSDYKVVSNSISEDNYNILSVGNIFRDDSSGSNTYEVNCNELPKESMLISFSGSSKTTMQFGKYHSYLYFVKQLNNKSIGQINFNRSLVNDFEHVFSIKIDYIEDIDSHFITKDVLNLSNRADFVPSSDKISLEVILPSGLDVSELRVASRVQIADIMAEFGFNSYCGGDVEIIDARCTSTTSKGAIYRTARGYRYDISSDRFMESIGEYGGIYLYVGYVDDDFTNLFGTGLAVTNSPAGLFEYKTTIKGISPYWYYGDIPSAKVVYRTGKSKTGELIPIFMHY